MNPSIFISYSSKNSDIADYIDEVFRTKGIKLTRDIRDVEFKKSFKEFMKKIRKTDFAILVISDHFLKSRYCMYEVIEFLKEENFKEKVLPVVLNDVALDPLGKTGYIKFWKEEYNKLKGEADDLAPEERGIPDQDLKHYKTISMHIGEFLDTISDMKYEPYEKLKATGFKVFFDEIKKKARYITPPQVKILAITASPENSPIFYEKEQDVLIDSVDKFDKDKLFLDIPDPVDSTLAEIKKYLETGRHDILQITAHGTINEDGEGILLFENARGNEVHVTGRELAETIKKENAEDEGLRVVIISSCHSARPEEHYLTVAKTLHEAGIPAVIGMRTTITHFAAIEFNTGFYNALMKGKGIKDAFDAGIKSIEKFEEKKRLENPDLVFQSEIDIPVLVTDNDDLSIADFSDYKIKLPERPKSHTFKTNYMERGFIGRRKIIREVFRKVREGKPAISLKGPGGIGKSTLTSRVMADLLREGYDFIEFQGRIEPSGIIEGLVKKAAGSDEKYKNLEGIINNAGELGDKARALVGNYLSKEKIVMILDNFEDNQDQEKKDYINPEMRPFLKTLKHCLQNRESFIFFTTRYELPGVVTDPINVPEFTPSEISKRFYYGEALSRLDEKSAEIVEYTVAKNPRAIDILNILLKKRFKTGKITQDKIKIYTEKLKEHLRKGKHPEEIDFSPFILGDLLDLLSPEQLNFLKASAIYRKPVKEEAFQKQNIHVNDEIVEQLENLSLIETVQTENASFIYMHRLTSAFLEEFYEIEEKKNFHANAARYFKNIKGENNQGYLEDFIEAEYHYKQAGLYNEAFEIMDSVQDYLLTHGYTFEALKMVEEFFDYSLTDQNRAYLLHSCGILLQSLGRYEDALKKYLESLEIKKRIGDVAGEAKSLHQVGRIYENKGDYDQALEKYLQSLEIAKRIGDVAGEAKSLHQVGNIYLLKGDYDQALEKYLESLEIAKRIGDVAGEAGSLHQVGMIYENKGDYDQALEKYLQSLEIKKRIGDVSGEAISLHQVGMIYQYKGDYDQALEKYLQSLEIKKRIGDVAQEAKSLHQVGNIYLLKGDYDQALKKYLQSLEIKKRIGDVSGEAKSLHQVGIIYQYKGDYDQALKKYLESLEIAKRIGNVADEAKSLHQVGNIYLLKGDYDQALEKYLESLEIAIRIGDINGMALTFGQLGLLSKTLEKYPEALNYFIEAFKIFHKIGSPAAKQALNDIKKMAELIPGEEFEAIHREKGIPPEELLQDNEAPSREEMMRQLIELYISLGEEKFVEMLKQNGAPREQIDQFLPAIREVAEKGKKSE